MPAKKHRQSLPQLIGSLIFGALVLGILINFWYLTVPAFVIIGLAYMWHGRKRP